MNTKDTIRDDPQFQAPVGFYPTEKVGCEQLPLPVFVNGELPACPTIAPTVGENTDSVMAEVLGKSAEEVAKLRDDGAFG